METDEEVRFIVTEEMYQEFILQYRKKAGEYLAQVDQCLANKSSDTVVQLIRIFQQSEVVQYYVSSLPLLSYGHIFAAITSDEIQKLQCPYFIMNGSSVEELRIIFKKLEFRLWETELGCGQDAEARLYEYIQMYRITPEALKRTIEVAGLNKKECYSVLACIFLDHQELENAKRILEYGLENYPDDEGYCQTLVQLCQKMGRREEQEQYEERLRCIQQ